VKSSQLRGSDSARSLQDTTEAEFIALKSARDIAERRPRSGAAGDQDAASRAVALRVVVEALERKPTGLRMDKAGVIYPRALVLAKTGVDDEYSFPATLADIRSQEGQQSLLPLFAEQELRLDRLEDELAARSPSVSRWYEVHYLSGPVFGRKDVEPEKEDPRRALSADACATLQAYRRSQLLTELLFRVRQRQEGKQLESREMKLRRRGWDLDLLAEELRRERRTRGAAQQMLVRGGPEFER
jgi:hypothetical protein